ncbi:hypothetical protein SAMN05192582_100717 [Bacteroides ovatus]|uniref:Uncharacterized protein n=1 Tax=Bacteroides ovatus TaxID=28116 RepID=A0A1G8CZ58_BACOV|nr:hypothetical protein SAMN05192582_100717 [Bacteroides ovatus]
MEWRDLVMMAEGINDGFIYNISHVGSRES